MHPHLRPVFAVPSVDGTLVPIHDRTMSASSKRNDCRAYTHSRVDQQCPGREGDDRRDYQGNLEVIGPHYKPRGQPPLPQWKEDLNTVHNSVRARRIQGQQRQFMVPCTRRSSVGAPSRDFDRGIHLRGIRLA